METYKNAFEYVENNKSNFPSTDLPPKKEERKKATQSSTGVMPNFSNLDSLSVPLHVEEVEPPKKKRNTKSSLGAVVTEKDNDTKSPDEIPYEEKYKETTGMLKAAVSQLDMNLAEMQHDVNQIRASKTLKRKYDYLSAMQGTIGQFINTKVSALREINSTISKCNDLELRRRKELNLAENDKDSDRAIMDMYNAFISMPSGGMSGGAPVSQNPLGPTVSQITMGGVAAPITADVNEDIGMKNYIDNMNPAQRLCLYENDPNVQQVIIFDNATGAKRFEVMNLATKEIIPNVDKRDMMFMDDVVLDLQAGVGRNINLNETYPIIEVGERMSDVY